MIAGISARHGGHHVPQKFKKTYFPPVIDLIECSVPLSSLKKNSVICPSTAGETFTISYTLPVVNAGFIFLANELFAIKVNMSAVITANLINFISLLLLLLLLLFILFIYNILFLFFKYN
ncbi:hypothetical protein SDC9_193999 [bioreactor metagenome]|uniref:Uncharacterized protein n=1 Tax=bioreactor metagenome TaxID=1076179 RepID=A0A645IGC5_9ZZZZ